MNSGSSMVLADLRAVEHLRRNVANVRPQGCSCSMSYIFVNAARSVSGNAKTKNLTDLPSLGGEPTGLRQRNAELWRPRNSKGHLFFVESCHMTSDDRNLNLKMRLSPLARLYVRPAAAAEQCSNWQVDWLRRSCRLRRMKSGGRQVNSPAISVPFRPTRF